MSGTSLGRLYVDLLAKTGGFETDMGRAARVAEKRAREIDRAIDRMADRVSSGFKGAALAAAGFAAGFVGVGQGFDVLRGAIAVADQVDELSARLGISTEKLSGLGFAAKLTGTDLEKIGTALPKLSAKIASGSEIFAEMGIEVEDANGNLRDSVELLPEIADLFKALNNDTLEQALAMELFGKSGAELLEFLNLGSAGIDDMAARLDTLGGTIDGETAAAAAAFNDQLDELKIGAQAFALQIAAELLPDLMELSGGMRTFVADGENARNTADGLSASFAILGGGIGVITDLFQWMGTTIGGLTAGADGLYNSLAGIVNLDWDRMREGWGLANIGADAAYNAFFLGDTETGASLYDSAGNTSPFANVTSRVSSMSERDQRLARRRAERMREAEERLLNGTFGAQSGGSAKRGQPAMTDEQRAAEQLAKAYDALIDRQAERLAQLAAELETGGKLGEAWRVAYEVQTGALQNLEPWQKLQVLINAETEDQLTLQQELRANQADDADRFDEYLAGLEREREVLGLSNLELRVRNALLGAGIELTAEQAAAIETSVLATEKTQRMVGALDSVRDITRELFFDLPNGAADAWEKAIDQIEARLWQWAASGVLDQLFGEAGTNGKGSIFGDLFGGLFGGEGGGFGGIFGSLFGGGRAIGGPVIGGKLYEVTERGLPELLNIGDRQLLMMPAGRSGMVTPMAPARGGTTMINNFHLGAPTDRRTQDQIAARVHFEGTRSARRSG
jgi:hypothetical protein